MLKYCFQFPLEPLLYLGETENSGYWVKKFGGGGKQDIFGNNVFHKQNKRYYMTVQRYKISFQVFSLILTQGEKFLYLQGGL